MGVCSIKILVFNFPIMNAPHSKKTHPAEHQLSETQPVAQSQPTESQPAMQNVSLESSVPAQERLLGAVAYIGPLFVAPFLKPKSTFCRFHANQGFVFFLVLFVVLILSGLSWIFSFLLTLGYLGMMLYTMYTAYQGMMWKIPILSDIAEKINIVKFADGWTLAPKTPSTPEASTPKQEEQPKQ